MEIGYPICHRLAAALNVSAGVTTAEVATPSGIPARRACAMLRVLPSPAV
jgi:hypothetical protein